MFPFAASAFWVSKQLLKQFLKWTEIKRTSPVHSTRIRSKRKIFDEKRSGEILEIKTERVEQHHQNSGYEENGEHAERINGLIYFKRNFA